MIDVDKFTTKIAELVREAIDRKTAPLLRRIESLETEVKHGHERIKHLEAMKGGNRD